MDGSNECGCCARASSMYWGTLLLVALFWTKGCGTLDSPTESVSSGAACPPQAPRICGNTTLCYPDVLHCDGKLDCPDGSDEASCEKVICEAGAESCVHGPCVDHKSGYQCCEADGQKCAADSSKFAWMSGIIRQRIIYAEGKSIYSLSLNDSGPKLLTTSKCCNIDALSYSVAKNRVFWTAGQHVWELSLNDRARKRHVGTFTMGCWIADMAYDWMTSNFYFVCKSDRVMVCNLLRGTRRMLCADLRATERLNVTSIALRADAGIIYVASLSSHIFEIHQMPTDGSSLLEIFQSMDFTAQNRVIRELKTGLVHEFSLEFVEEQLSKTVRDGTQPSPIEENTLLRFLWNGTQLSLPLNGTRPGTIISLFDEKRQPSGFNHTERGGCDNHTEDMGCGHICVLLDGMASCICDSQYKLMKDDRTCCKETDHACTGRDYSKDSLPIAVWDRDLPKVLLLHASYIAAVFFSWVTGIACYYLGRRSRARRRTNRFWKDVPFHFELEKITNTV